MSDTDHSPGATGTLRFGVFEIDRRAGELRRAGRIVPMAAQPMRVLIHLVERAGHVVTRQELRREIWGDETHVDFDAGLSTCINQIRTALGDRALSPRYIETLPRRGYRFIPPLHDEPAHAPAPVPAGKRSRQYWAVAAGVTLVMCIAVISFVLPLRREITLPAPIPIVVVPVQIDSARPEFHSVAETMTHALIGHLASQAGTRARIASGVQVKHLSERDFTLDDLRAIGAEFFVHVTLRSLAEAVLVHAKAAHISGWIVWSSDEEIALPELERRQAQIAAEIARRVAREILPTRPESARRAPNAAAVGHYAQAKADVENGRLEASLVEFDKAQQADHTHPGSHAGMAQATIEAVCSGLLESHTGFAKAVQGARRALALDPDSAVALAAMGALAWLRDVDPNEAERYLVRALSADPALEWAQVWLAHVRERTRPCAK